MLICWPFVWIWDIHPWGSQPRGAIWNETLECPYSMHPIHSLDAMHCNKDTWRADRPPHPHRRYRMHYASKCCKCLWYLPTFPTFSKVFRFIFLSFFPNFPGPSLRFLTFSCIFPIFFFRALGDVFPETIFATRASIRGFSKFAFVPPWISILFYMEIHEVDALTSYEVICSCPCLNQFFEREGCQDFYFEFSHVSRFTNGNHVWHRIY